MFPKKMVKVICLVLAALMILSGVAVLIQVFAADTAAISATVTPKTGENDMDTIVPIALIAAAVLAIAACLILPKIKKKK
ncbi:MAG: hypothetical protein J6D79_05550 [Clostridia bacterium]|nr:hypothetical protein [Clostridia bacterium]